MQEKTTKTKNSSNPAIITAIVTRIYGQIKIQNLDQPKISFIETLAYYLSVSKTQ